MAEIGMTHRSAVQASAAKVRVCEIDTVKIDAGQLTLNKQSPGEIEARDVGILKPKLLSLLPIRRDPQFM
jgi:hypothetical protein